MRRPGLVLVLGAVLVSGCSGRPNDLSDGAYYDEASTPATTTTASPAAPSTSTRPSPAPSARADRQDAQRVAKALLSDAVLAAEGFQAATPARPAPARPLPPCVPGVDLEKVVQGGQQATWQGVRTRVPLRQYVGVVVDGNAADLVRAARRAGGCAGATGLQLPALPGADARVAWCVAGTIQPSCRMLVARGNLLTDVEVGAATPTRSRELATQLAPLIAQALTTV
ncbi:hypothetical protein [Longimycelium tulufanense]|uniref:hypothetical protein n=1 Tax=Longimycelium tulufanense TaxID=907463 RepID=UPI001663218F|nr:hypothetical protein [Longimycelium tulufanense]